MKTKARYYGAEIYYGGEMKVEDMEKFLGDLRESMPIFDRQSISRAIKNFICQQ